MFDKKIPIDKVFIGEKLRVTTKTGRLVCYGTVQSTYPQFKSIMVRGEIDPTLQTGELKQVAMDHMYQSDLYDFYSSVYTDETPAEDMEPPVVHPHIVKDKTLNDGGFQNKKPMTKEATDTDDNEEDDEDDDDSKSSGKKTKDTVSVKDKEVDVSKLPKEVQQQVKGTDTLDVDKADIIMSKVSDSARQALKAAGMKDTDLYKMVVEIQNAIEPILSKKRKK